MTAAATSLTAMSRLISEFPLTRKQVKSIVECRDVRIAAWTGAVRSGKTIGAIVAFLFKLMAAPTNGLIIIAGKTLSTIARNVIVPMQDPELFGALASEVKYTRGSTVAIILGRTVHLLGAADARSENKLRGLTAYLIMIDEATLIPQEFFDQALARLSVPGAQLMFTTNPAGPKHWLRQKYLLGARERGIRLGHWHFTIDDNTKLDPEYVRSLKAEMTGVFYQRNILGHWVAAEGAVYGMWDDDRHLIRGALPPIMALPGVGIDHGIVNPFSAVMIGLTRPYEGIGPKLVATREYRHDPAVQMRQLTDVQFSAELRRWIGTDRPEWIAVDPSAQGFKGQLFDDGLTNVVNAHNAVMDGIRLVQSLLTTGRLLVHESCHGLIDEIGGYSWDPAAQARGDDRPLKVDDHSCDALRYGVNTTRQLWQEHIPTVSTPAVEALAAA